MANTGLTFYDLISKYEGDVSTSGCGVTKHQLDMNFYNLKSEDIKNAYWDAENRKLVILFYNGQKLEVGDINPYDLEYKEEEQTLIGVTADGKKFAIATGLINDGSLEGDNTFQNPIGVARSLRTGFHMPAMRVVTELPKDGLTNVKYVYKTNEDRLGRLYTAEEIIKIDDYLKSINSPWHVPTKEEWDNMLNAIEPCDADKNHDKVDVDAGRIAGELLKDGHLWDGYNSYNFSLLPVDTMVKMGGIKSDGEVFGKIFKSEIETSSNTTINNKVFGASINTDKLYALRLVKYGVFHEHEKVMDEEYDCVKMPAWKDGKYLAPMVWLAQNLYEDDILGTTIGTYVPSKKIEPTYYVVEYDSLISDWHRFKMNIGDSIYCMNDNSIYTLIHTEEDGCVLETSNDIYNSSILDSYYDPENQQLVITFKDNNRIQEIGLNLDKLIESIQSGIDDMNKKINDEITNRKNADSKLSDSINNEATARKDADKSEANARATADKTEHDARVAADKEELNARIKADSDEKDARINADVKEYNERVSADTAEREARMLGDMQETKNRTEADNLEKEARINADNALLAQLSSECVNRIYSDDKLAEALSSETFAREEKDKELQESIDKGTSSITSLDEKIVKETNDRLLGEEEILQRVEDESTARESADSAITKSITDEAKERESADVALDERVDTLEETIEGVKEKVNGEDDKIALLQKALEDEVRDRQLADEKESTDRITADENETKDRQFADDLLRDLVKQELDARKTADDLLKANIETLKALITLSSDVDKEAIDKLMAWFEELTLRINGVESGLTEEQEVRESADEFLQEQIDELREASGSPISEEVVEYLQGQIDVLDEKVDELSGRTISADTTILQEEIDELDDKIDVVEERVDDIDDKIVELSGRTLSADTTFLQEEIDILDEKIAELSGRTLSADTTILQEEIDDLREKVSELSGRTVSADTTFLQEEIDELIEKINKINTSTNEISGNTIILQDEVDEIKDEISHITSGGTIDTGTELAIAGALNYLRYQQLNMLQRLHDLDGKGAEE